MLKVLLILLMLPIALASPIMESESNFSAQVANETTGISDSSGQEVKINCNFEEWIDSKYCSDNFCVKYIKANDCSRVPWSKHLCCIHYYLTGSEYEKSLKKKLEDNQENEYLDENINEQKEFKTSGVEKVDLNASKLNNQTKTAITSAVATFWKENMSGIIALCVIIVILTLAVLLFLKYIKEKKIKRVIAGTQRQYLEKLIPFIKEVKARGHDSKAALKLLTDFRWGANKEHRYDEDLVKALVYRVYARWKLVKIKF